MSLDAGCRMEALPALMLWDLAIDVFHPQPKSKVTPLCFKDQEAMYKQRYDMFNSIDFVPPILPITYGRAFFLLEDNDAVIKMVIKERSPAMWHIARTHRVDLDWLFERLNRDPAVFIKFVGTKEQLADIHKRLFYGGSMVFLVAIVFNNAY